MLTDSERDLLRRAAVEAAGYAHAPYSEFHVGAAVLGARAMYRGANVENASFGLSLCAERSALSAAIASGDREIRGLAVACVDADPAAGEEERMPCGACRQWILELAPNAEILIQGVDGVLHIGDLLPKAFRLGRK
jgi:cytidine deaminase